MSRPNRSDPPSGGFWVEIVVEGVVDERWRHRFADLDFQHLEAAKCSQTLMTGSVRDQAQLHAVLHAVRDLGLTLVSIQQRRE